MSSSESGLLLCQKNHAEILKYAVLSSVSRSYPPLSGRLLMHYSPVRHWIVNNPVRLACVRRAASVRPEPGSNSLNLALNHKTIKKQNSNYQIHGFLALFNFQGPSLFSKSHYSITLFFSCQYFFSLFSSFFQKISFIVLEILNKIASQKHMIFEKAKKFRRIQYARFFS